MAGSWNGTRYDGDETNEAVTGTAASETILTNAGDDQAFGGDGNDYIDGGVGNDLLVGGNGADVLTDVGYIPFGFVGLIGHDTLRGGNGSDELRVYSPDTGDVADGGAGFDLLRLNFQEFNPTGIPPGTPLSLVLGPNGAASQLQINGIDILDISNIEQLYFRGSDGTNFVTAQAGNDALIGGSGEDHLFGGAGNDDIYGGTGQQDLDGGDGIDTVSFDLSGTAFGLTLTNGGTFNLGAAGSARNFEYLGEVILGSGADTITITQDRSVDIYGGEGADRIRVGDAGCQIDAGFGDDVIITGSGSDDIDGGWGADAAHMGAGDDLYHQATRLEAGNKSIWGEMGDDGLYTAAGDDHSYGGLGDDTIYTGKGNDLAYGGSDNDDMHGEDGSDTLYGDKGNDIIDSDADALSGDALVEADVLYGGEGNDRLTGGYGKDSLYGGTGNDTLIIGPNTSNTTTDALVDSLVGGLGDDRLSVYGPNYYMSQIVTIILRPTTQILFDGVLVATATGMESLETFTYGSGNHHLEGGGLGDVIITGQGSDLVRTFGGNDVIESTFGSDTIEAGAGNDTIRSVEVGGHDSIAAGLGDDQVLVSVAYLNQTLEAGVSQIDGGRGFDTLTLYTTDRDMTFNGTSMFVAGVKVATFTGFEQLVQYGTNSSAAMVGYAGNDLLSGYGGDDTLHGLLGNDTLDGGIGNDLLYGGAGDDSLASGGGADAVYGGSGDDRFTLSVDGLADTIDGGLGNDVLTLPFGAASAIVMTGSLASGATVTTGGVLQATVSGIEVVTGSATNGNDVMLGGVGNDTISLQAGADTASTGLGDDTLSLTLDAGADTIDAGLGMDQVNANQSLAGNLRLVVVGGTTTVTIGGVLVDTWEGVERISLSAGSGNDTVIMGAGDDTAYLGTGANKAQMKGGSDQVTITLDGLTDTLDGGLGVDTLVVYGGASGYEVDLSTPGLVLIKDGTGVLARATGFEDLALYGGYSDTAHDRLLGLAGDDTLYGNAGNDTINGGAGNDRITGGAGQDLLTGAGGADVFAFQSLTDATPGAILDRITDFTQGADIIDLGAIDANSGNFGFSNDAFTFIGTQAFSHVAGELRYQVFVPGNRVFVVGDTNGDAIADIRFAVTGSSIVLTQDDFAL